MQNVPYNKWVKLKSVAISRMSINLPKCSNAQTLSIPISAPQDEELRVRMSTEA